MVKTTSQLTFEEYLEYDDGTDKYYNTFYIGTRATGGDGGHHAFIGPGWTGTLPAGVTPHYLPYNSCLFALRIWIDPNDVDGDMENVTAYQNQFSLTSLSNWESGNYGEAAVPESITLETRPSYDGELSVFQTIADLMIENPPTEEYAAQVEPFKYIGLVAGQKFAPESLSEPTQRGLARAAVAGDQIMQWKVKYRGTPYTSRWNNLHSGTYGFDFLDRAVGTLEGLFVHDNEEAIYFSTYESYDEETGGGEFLNSTNNYILHFDADELPTSEDKGFWSLTMYGPDYQLVANKIDRFLINKDTAFPNEDGSLDIYIQSKAPKSPQKFRNWLPCPEEEDQLFRINYRIYLPTSYTLTG